MPNDICYAKLHVQPATQPRPRASHAVALFLLCAALLLSGCGRRPEAAAPATQPPPSPTAAATATAVAPEPAAPDTSAVAPAGAEAVPAAAAVAQTVIPANFTPFQDEARGYALALPPGWTQFDLRGEQFRNTVARFGMEEQLTPLFDFLETPAGNAIGLVAATDLTGMIFGGLPTALNVAVIDTPGLNPDQVVTLAQEWLARNQGAVGDITIEMLEPTTINGLPAVRAQLVADLSTFGLGAPLYVEAVGLRAGDKLFLLTLATESAKRGDKAAEFAAIIGAFGPQ